MICVNECYNMDCADGMREMLEQGMRADWLITDPPYGIGWTKMTGGGSRLARTRDYVKGQWDDQRIGEDYFRLMFAVSENQLIFGGNYYTDILPPTKSWCVWDKRANDENKNDFADCELAWVSTGVARLFSYLYNGMMQGSQKNKDIKFHPTQKPTQLWIKLLNFYTKPSDLIVDPFAGSQSLRIACHRTGRNYIGFEIDKYYYEKGSEWFARETNQVNIFDFLTGGQE